MSQGKCGEMEGFDPVKSLTTAQSSIFSKIFVGSPIPGNLPNLVPPVPTPQEGKANLKSIIFFFRKSKSTFNLKAFS